MIDWKAGDKVQCIDSLISCAGETLPIVGNIYTIREILAWGPEVVIRLVEIANEPHLYSIPIWACDECGFPVSAFRKVIERSTETGMEILRKLLDPTKHKVLEDA